MADNESAHELALESAALDALADGPVELVRLVAVLATQGVIDYLDVDESAQADEVALLLARRDDIWISATDVVAHLDGLLSDIVLTHRVTTDEVEFEVLHPDPDLEVVDHDRFEPFVVAGGTVARVFTDEHPHADPDTGSFVGPAGWLNGAAVDGFVAFRRRGGSLVIEAITDIATISSGQQEADALRQAFDARVDMPGIGELADSLVLDALTANPALFRSAVPPVSDLLASVGLSCERGWVGPADTDWVPPYLAEMLVNRNMIIERYALDDCCLELLDKVMGVWNEFVFGAPVDDLPWQELGNALRHGWVAAAMADDVLRDDVEPHSQLAHFAAELAASSVPGIRSVADYLQSRNLEHGGDAVQAETLLESSLSHDPSFLPAMEDLAWFAADRGDGDKALNLLRRSGAKADDPEIKLLESMRPARNAVGRNDQCPCGSGRKYKECCQRNPVLAIDRKAEWLTHKLWTYVLRPHRQKLVFALAIELSPEGDDDELDELMAVGLPMDLAVLDTALAAMFLDERGALLPSDERAMLETWINTPRRLWQVVELAGASSLVLRDLATQNLQAVIGVDGAGLEVDDLLLGRVAPVGPSHRFVGVPIDVPTSQRSSAEALVATEPDVWDIAEWFAAVTRPTEAG